MISVRLPADDHLPTPLVEVVKNHFGDDLKPSDGEGEGVFAGDDPRDHDGVDGAHDTP